MTHAAQALAKPEQRSGVKLAKIEGIKIKLPFKFGISGEQNLKAPIHMEPIDLISTHPTAHAVRGFKQQNRTPSVSQRPCSSQTG